MEDEQVKKLAETLKEQGLAASMYEAMEKAKSIIGVGPQKEEAKETKPKPETADQEAEEKEILSEQPKDSGEDILKSNVTVNELMQEVGVSEQEVAEQEQKKIEEIKEEVNEIKEDIQEAQQDPDKVMEVKEEISHVKEEIAEIAEEKGQEPQQATEQGTDNSSSEKTEEEKEDRFKEEKKIDLTKVFGSRK